ncbi:MAG: helicase, partial [Aeromicrobium sp.]|nr:helicase [Aeromicrobium sp.]
PETRQTMLFSATMPGAIVGLARKHMRHPMNIRAESGDDNQMVPATAQFVWQAHEMDKAEIVGRILQADDVGKVLVFTRTKRTAQRVADELIDRGFPASPLHGDMAQPAREKALARFREGKVDILVATDVAARGIDVAGITHVINYNCPEDDKTYVHRIGRTGRAGASGIAVTFVDWADLVRWKLINTALGLPFDEPQETYSTSDHLFHDLGIDRNVKGRLKAASPREPKKDDDRGGRGRSGAGRGGDRGGRTESKPQQQSSPNGSSDKQGEGRPRSRNRNRTRSRGGAPVAKTD